MKQLCVMLLLNKTDSETKFSLEWTNENGIVPDNRQSYVYGTPPKCSLLIKRVTTKDSGIYQCVRTFQNETEDRTNVILHVSSMYYFLESFLG